MANTPPSNGTSISSSAQNATQRFLPIGDIRNDTLVLKDGGMRAILKTTAVNFNLKSEDEQNSLIYAYQSFLNTLEFPIQIVIRSQKLDIDGYLEYLKQKAQKQQNPLLRRQSFDYIAYVKKLVEYADIMEKNFYIVVPFEPPSAPKRNAIQQFLSAMRPDESAESIRTRLREFERSRKLLTQRVQLVTAGLEGCGLRVTELNTAQLSDLYYTIYNPVMSRRQKIGNIGDTDLLPQA